MPLEFIGMIGVSPESRDGASVHVIGGGVDGGYLRDFARTHEAAGFDLVLVGYTSASAEGFVAATHAAAHTERLSYLIAHRPGFVAPTLAARKVATFDNLTGGRVALHVISGGHDAEQRRDGDYLGHDERYRRTDEYLEVMRKTWTSDTPFDFDGDFYSFTKAFSQVKPVQQPHPRVFFGGSSEAALRVGAGHADVYALWGEPLAAIAEQIDLIRAMAAPHGRRPEFSVSFRPILGPTEDAAWERAHRILATIEAADHKRNKPLPGRPQNVGSRRLLDFAEQGEIHDERLWFPIAAASGAQGNSSCLVGTPEQVADAIVAYYDIGVRYILIRGFDPMADAAEFGEELIPRVQGKVAEREAVTAGAMR